MTQALLTTEQLSDSQAIRSIMVFVAAFAERSLRQATLNRWRDLGAEMANAKPVLIVETSDDGMPIGAAGCLVMENGVDCSFVVVNPDFRRQGYGKKLLAAKVAAVVAMGRTFETIVAADKEIQLKLVTAAGLVEHSRMTLTRSNGDYEAIRFVNNADANLRDAAEVVTAHTIAIPDRSEDDEDESDESDESDEPDFNF